MVVATLNLLFVYNNTKMRGWVHIGGCTTTGSQTIDLEASLKAQHQFVVDKLRCPPLPMALRPIGAVMYGRECSVINSDDGGRVEVTIAIAVPTPTTVARAVLQVCGC